MLILHTQKTLYKIKGRNSSYNVLINMKLLMMPQFIWNSLPMKSLIRHQIAVMRRNCRWHPSDRKHIIIRFPNKSVVGKQEKE